jgi:hypothetical protein
MSFDFFPNEQDATLRAAARQPSRAPEPGVWTGFLPGAARYTMRSLAEAGRAVDMLGAAFPIAIDAVTGGTERQNTYFREHDEVFNRAVEFWTPSPADVGAAGQITGQLLGGVAQVVVSPALLVGTAQLGTAEDLVRQAVDAGTANTVGGIAGTGTAVGLRLPFLGKTLASRVGSGAGGNVVQGAATAGASSAVLNAAGHTEQAKQFDPADFKARALDAALGAAFGGLAHVSARMSPTDDAALLVTNQARHMQESTLPAMPVTETDATAHVQALRAAVEQTLRGEVVSVDQVLRGTEFVPDAALASDRAEITGEILRLAREQDGGQPIELPPEAVADAARAQTAPDAAPKADADPVAGRARKVVADSPDLVVPLGEFLPDGTPATARAADLMARADAELRAAEGLGPEIFRTAAACMLGAV